MQKKTLAQRKGSRAVLSYEIRIISRGRKLRELGAKAFLDYINPFVDEKSRITVEKKVTLENEGAWLEKSAKQMDRKELVDVVLFVGNELSGICEIRRNPSMGDGHNVWFGLSVSRKYRELGFGALLMQRGIAEAKRRFRPHRMWLDHYEGNKNAARLYSRLGFARVALLKEYHRHYGKYDGKVIREYRGK